MGIEPHTVTKGVRCKQTLKNSNQTAPEFSPAIPQQDSPTFQSGTSDCSCAACAGAGRATGAGATGGAAGATAGGRGWPGW